MSPSKTPRVGTTAATLKRSKNALSKPEEAFANFGDGHRDFNCKNFYHA